MNFFSIMRGFTIQTRMYSAIVVVLSLLILVGGVGLYGMKQNHDAAQAWQEAAGEAQTMATLHGALGQLRLHEKQMLLSAGSASAVDTQFKAWQNALDKYKATANKMLEGEEDEDNPVIKSTLTQLDQYKQGVEAVQSGLGQADATPQAAMSKLASTAALADKLEDELIQVDKIVSTELTASTAAQDKNLSSTMAWFIASVVLAIVIVAPTTILNQLSICGPIEQARQMAVAISHGDLSRHVSSRGQDELTQLLTALNQMQESLKAIVGDVRRSADSIAVASTEIASGNMDLSSRTESTASSLQETASSMLFLTIKVVNTQIKS